MLIENSLFNKFIELKETYLPELLNELKIIKD